MSRIDLARVPVDENGKRLARLPGRSRESTDSRERALQSLGTQWLKAMRFADCAGVDRAVCCELSTLAIANELAAVPAEYGQHQVYGGRGPVLRPLDGEANLDSADGQLGPAQIAELRDSADEILADAWSADARYDVALEVVARLAS